MNLTPATTELIDTALRQALQPLADDELIGVSCIATGADSLFARAVLDLGGRLEVILPTANYRERKVRPQDLQLFDELLNAASQIRYTEFSEPNRDAYEAANEMLLNSSDTLIAVWDGQAPADKGGTAAVIASASARQLPVAIIWPEGAQRS